MLAPKLLPSSRAQFSAARLSCPMTIAGLQSKLDRCRTGTTQLRAGPKNALLRRASHTKRPLVRLSCKAQSGRQEQETLTAATATTQPPAAASTETLGGPISSFASSLFLAGAVLGPLLDGIHGTVDLTHYDSLPFNVLGLHSSVWVPPLLGAFYLAVGGLNVWLDKVALDSPEALAAAQKVPGGQLLVGYLQDPFNVRQTRAVFVERASIPAVALGTGALAWLLEVSANLYMNDVPYIQVHGALLALTVFNWSILDATRQGTLLAVLCGIAAPLSEVAIMRLFGLWHYPRADVAGIVSWTAWCYALYVPALGNLARCLWQRAEEGSRLEGK